MKKRSFISLLFMALLAAPLAVSAQDQTIETMPAVVVKTIPESGSSDVAPGVAEIRVTFSKKMAAHSWSWATAWQGSTPEIIGKPSYDADGKTCVLKVKLESGKTYGYWINSEKFHNFKDRQGISSVSYLLVFKTKAG
jgi:RNA polymerase sigma-70 factor (ECF subfamily)